MHHDEKLEFLKAQISNVEEAANAVLFPQLQYSDLVPVKKTEALGVQEYQGSKFDFSFTDDEIEAAMAAGVDLSTDKATGTRRVMERTINEIVLKGDLYHNWPGLINAPSPQTLKVTSEVDWSEAPSDQIIDDINRLVEGTRRYGGELADTLVLPLTTASRLASQPFLGKTLLETIKEVTVYTGMTGRPLSIRAVPDLEDAGIAKTRRAIAYWRDSSVLRLHLPTACAFREPERQNQGRYVVPGYFRTSGLKIVRPEGIRYLDGI